MLLKESRNVWTKKLEKSTVQFFKSSKPISGLDADKLVREMPTEEVVVSEGRTRRRAVFDDATVVDVEDGEENDSSDEEDSDQEDESVEEDDQEEEDSDSEEEEEEESDSENNLKLSNVPSVPDGSEE